MAEDHVSLPRLSYRALTGTNLEELGKRVDDAIKDDDYTLLGELSSASNGEETMYVQAVISPVVTTYARAGEEEILRILHKGGTDRAFCERISLLLDSGSWQLEKASGPVINVVGGHWQLTQEVFPLPLD